MVKPPAEPLPKIAQPKKPLIHVLHVDDEPEYLKTTKTILEMQGTFKMETASSVEEAMKKMETKTFDAIISDYIMPGIDGLEFLRELRASGNTTPFIIFTGKGRGIVAIKALNLGADQYINKIGNPETVYSELSHGIYTVVKGRRAEEERKVAKKALQESEEKYQKMIEWASDSIMTFDLNGLIISCNNVSITMAGQTKEELIGKHFSELRVLTEEQIQSLMKSFPFMSEEEKPEPFEIERTDENGSSFFGEVHINLMKEGKKVTGFQTITRDITQRKQMEKQLKESEEKYRSFVELSPDGILSLDMNGVVTSVNQAILTQTGFSEKDFLGKHFTQLAAIPPENLSELTQEVDSFLRGTPPETFELGYCCKDGTHFVAEASVGLMMQNGEPCCLQMILRDITARKKAEAALKKSEEKYRETIENSNVGIICYGPDGELKILNPKMEQMTGYTMSEIPTLQDWFEKLYPNNEERHKIRHIWFKRMAEEGEVKEGHATITTKTGKLRNLLFNGVRLQNGDSIVFAIDITESTTAWESLDETINWMMAINEKLSVIGKLTRHDARNKLAVITNNVYLAKNKLAPNDSTLENLSDIELAIDQMVKIFDFARNYEMLGVEELSYTDVDKSFDEAVRMFTDVAKLKIMNECQGLAVMADSMLRQVFYNFIDDTVKYGEKVTQIRIYYEEEAEHLKLVYEDDGVGIPADEKGKIFLEGYGKGTGFGLYLIRKICESYGWTINETGVPGEGARFVMTIPKKDKNGKMSYNIKQAH